MEQEEVLDEISTRPTVTVTHGSKEILVLCLLRCIKVTSNFSSIQEAKSDKVNVTKALVHISQPRVVLQESETSNGRPATLPDRGVDLYYQVVSNSQSDTILDFDQNP